MAKARRKMPKMNIGRKNTNKKNNKEVFVMEKNANNQNPVMVVGGKEIIANDSIVKNEDVATTDVTTTPVDTVENVETVDATTEKQETTETPLTEEKDETVSKENKKEKPKENKKKDKPVVEVPPFERKTRLEKSNQNRTFKYLFKNREKLKFDLAIQRKEVWTLEQKSNLIHSILYGYPVPPVMVMETDDDKIWFLDGKQRGTTVLSFLSDEWAISKKTPSVCGVNIAGKKFSELPEDMQDVIYDETITLIKIKGLTDEERDEMFVRWNSGTALSKIELTRAKHSDLMEQVNEISELEFFTEDIAMTKTGRNRFQDQEIVMQIAMLLEKGRDGIKGFGSKDIDNYVMEKKDKEEVLPDSLIVKINKTATFMNMTSSDLSLTQKKKILKKANTPVIFYLASEIMADGIKPSIYSEFLIKFLDVEYDKDSEYGQTLQSSVSKRDNVVTRISILQFAFNEFLEEISKTRQKKDIYKSVTE